ncbi:MAG TPA: hypothetical protein DEE98_03740 [Elusimicrobia bacterium]|nr:hypothetical protein [Elusimicrobiota bacterium]
MTIPPSEGILFAQGLEGPTYASGRTLTEPPASLWRRPCKTEVPEPRYQPREAPPPPDIPPPKPPKPPPKPPPPI